MKITSLANALVMSRRDFNLNHVDLFVLNEIFCADNNVTSIMKIVENSAASVSRATLHKHVKKLCKDGLLTKREDPKNMRFKMLEPGEKLKEFLVKLGEIE